MRYLDNAWYVKERLVDTCTEHSEEASGGLSLTVQCGTGRQGMSMYDLWILNMLKTHAGGLDLDGIHSKLCLFIPDYDKSKAELHQGLQRMLGESKVLLEGTVYRMPNA